MFRPTIVVSGFLASVATLLLLNAPAFAQSGISGVVKDSSGAVMPGVTVEASSPALIEKVRAVTTGTDGQFNLVDLRPGLYTVTFSLPGFSAIKNEGINLPANFTATVNAVLQVGSVEETLTVTGDAPAVDLKSAVQATELSHAMLDALPTGRSAHNFAVAVPGVTGVNLGGFPTGRDSNRLNAFGSSSYEATLSIDGDRINHGGQVGGPFTTTRSNPAMVGELAVVTTGAGAQYGAAGVQMNLIPKEGGDKFTGYLYSMYTSNSLDASNVTPDLRAQGVTKVGVVKQWDFDPAFGGPIKPGKVWFYASYRNSEIQQYRPGMYENATPGAWTYTNDLSRPSTATITDPDESIRVTAQPTSKDKFKFYASWQRRIMNYGFELNTVSNEATTNQHYPPNRTLQAMWNRTVSSKLLLDAGFTRYDVTFVNYAQPGTTGEDPNAIAVTEQTTGLQFRSPQSFGNSGGAMWTYHGSASYVTGAHYARVGFSLIQNHYFTNAIAAAPHQDITYTLRNGIPISLTQYAPAMSVADIKADAALYAQDQWTLKRMTLNLGLRYEYYNGYNEPTNQPATRFVGARSFPGTQNTPDWRDLNPRFAIAYDLFGNAKTALKFSVGRYVAQQAIAAVTQASPTSLSIQTATRTWTDANNNYIPDCNFANLNANGECGKLSNPNLGSNDPSVATADPAILHGFGVRPYQWETTGGIQRQIMSGWSVSGTYVRRSFGNFTITKNLTVSPADYDPYCIVAPVDPRLPGGGGNQICGLYDIKPQFFGIPTQSIVTAASQFGNETQTYNGVDVSTTAHLKHDIQLLGGVTIGRIATNTCFIVNSPQEMRFCSQVQPFQPVFKMSATLPIRWGVNATVLVQSLPGGQNNISSTPYNTNNGIQANYAATNAEIEPSLGRNLAAGPNATVTIPLITPNTMYTDRQTMVNARFTRPITIGVVKVVPGIEVDNLFNASTPFSVNNVYGPAWLTVSQIMNPRAASISLQMQF
jgi:hypothetical protein